jgi:hypothetical protein
MTITLIMLNLAMSLPAVTVLAIATRLVLRAGSDTEDGEGRADWRGPFR